MKQDDQRLGLLKDTLGEIFGLKKKTTKRVIAIIKGSPDSINVRTPIVRSRVGTRSLVYLKNAIEIAKKKQKKDDKKVKKTNEGHTLIDFLIQESMIDVDLSDAQGSMAELRRAQRINKSNPDRLNKENQMAAKEERRAAQQSAGDDPSSHLKAQAAKKKEEVAMLNKKITQQQKNANNQAPIGEDVWVEIDVDEDGNVLTEAAVRQFKRVGKKIVRKYRCISGPKKGRISANPADCVKRKDPKKVRQGRKTMRSKKGTIARKSKIAKRTSISKIVTKMNARLMGSR